MIKSFSIGNQIFSLIPKQILDEPQLNIFFANSMTLLIGPNGSGKTQTLSKVASAISQGTEAGVEVDWSDVTDATSTFAMYFTPIPYGSNMPHDSNRYTTLKSRTKNQSSLSEMETAIDLSKEFKLNISPTLILPSYSKFLTWLKDLLFFNMRIASRGNRLVLDQWLEPIFDRQISIDNRREVLRQARRQNQDSFEEMFKNPDWHQLNTDEVAIAEEFSKALEKNLGSEVRLRLRAAQYVIAHQKMTRDVKLELLIKIGLTTSETPKKKQPTANKSFAHALDNLKKIGTIVKDQNLKKDRYEVNIQEWRDLSKISSNGLAELSILGVSSGVAALLDQFTRIRGAINKISRNSAIRNLLILIDEGDAFLHLEWQQKYVNYLDLTISNVLRNRFDCIQIILTTHSPVLMSDFPKDCVHRLASPTVNSNGKINDDELISFGAPLDTIVRSTGNAGTLGTFSARIIRNLLDDISKGEKVHKYRIEMIDDPVIKNHIQRIYEEKQSGLQHAN